MSITNSAMDDLTHNLEELLLLFDRPMEPIYMPKGEELAIIDIPNDYLVSIYE